MKKMVLILLVVLLCSCSKKTIELEPESHRDSKGRSSITQIQTPATIIFKDKDLMEKLYKWYYNTGWALPGTMGLEMIEEKYGKETRKEFERYKDLKFTEKMSNLYKQAQEEMP
jgi:hypothetical protein